MTDAGAERKRRWVRPLQRYLFNPPVKLAVWLGVYPGHVLIETRGRRTGRRRRTVVGMVRVDGTGWIVAEHGRHAGYVRNLMDDPAVRIRQRARWAPAWAYVEHGDDPLARLEHFPAVHAAAVRAMGTDLLTVRVEFDAAGA